MYFVYNYILDSLL